MSTRSMEVFESAVEAAEKAELGDFDGRFPGNRRNAYLWSILTALGWAGSVLIIVAMHLASKVDGESAPFAEYVALAVCVALGLIAPFGIRASLREARATIYLFEEGLVSAEREGDLVAVPWRDVVLVHRTSVRSSTTGREVRRYYTLLLVSGAGALVGKEYARSGTLLRAVEAAIADGRLRSREAAAKIPKIGKTGNVPGPRPARSGTARRRP
ncbi:hypothetical protein ABH920_003511 [Catenulispora sp. EB89]|uniref:hypothetical protein n=1 Tax=Catenulispora sp. EB89 TaxID=3156257 RepID=UPI003516FE53